VQFSTQRILTCMYSTFLHIFYHIPNSDLVHSRVAMQIVVVRAQLFLHTHIRCDISSERNPLKLNVTIHGSHFHSFRININSSRVESRIIPADDYTRRFSSRIHSALFPVSSCRVALQTRAELKISNAVTLIRVAQNLMNLANKKKTYPIESSIHFAFNRAANRVD